MTTNNALNNVELDKAGGTMTGLITMSACAINQAQANDIASASTVNIGAAAGNYMNITGTTTITAFDTIQAGTIRNVKFTGALTLTHNASSLILPNNGSNITTAAGDTAQFVSLGSGNWICTSYIKANGQSLQTGPAGQGGLKSFQIFTSGTAATYTKPASVTSILVECLGGGGGGGGVAAVSSQGAAAGGGGGGGYCRKYIASAASTYTYTVGAAANGGTAGNNNGTAGNASSFSTLTANGGGLGNGGAAGGVALGGAGGSGGTASGGDINLTGGNGEQGVVVSQMAFAGAGGPSPIYGALIPGGRQTAGVGAGTNAPANSGSGGSGAGSNGSGVAQAGGNGAAGLIIVWEFS